MILICFDFKKIEFQSYKTNMKQLLFKILNAAFITGTFLHYMLNEKYPLIVIQSLTYQVRLHKMEAEDRV